jgi:dTDP-4-amino-4,6-dideoxygalactose transaminase
MGNFDAISQFERALCTYTGAPYAIMTDCCTHAIELCLRYERPSNLAFTAYTYLSVPMLMHKLGIEYRFVPEVWTGEYRLHGSRIWDSARRLERQMYRAGYMQCLSFGHGKPLQIGRGGAILLDDAHAYRVLLEQRYDGRDLTTSPWQDQKVFRVGYHYRPTIEEAERGLELLPNIDERPKYVSYPDLREIRIIA